MAKFRSKDWWLGRTGEQQERKRAARQQWQETRSKRDSRQTETGPTDPSPSEDAGGWGAAPTPPGSPEASPSRETDHQAALDRFYELQGEIEAAKDARDFDGALQRATEAAASLEAFVAAWRAEEVRLAAAVGRELGDDWFRIKSIVAVDAICQLAPARLDDDVLRWLREQLVATPELAPWIPSVDDALADVDAARSLVAEIAQEPGVEQAGLAKKLGLDGQRTRSMLYWMEQDGRVTRQKSGRTYALYLSEPGKVGP